MWKYISQLLHTFNSCHGAYLIQSWKNASSLNCNNNKANNANGLINKVCGACLLTPKYLICHIRSRERRKWCFCNERRQPEQKVFHLKIVLYEKLQVWPTQSLRAGGRACRIFAVDVHITVFRCERMSVAQLSEIVMHHHLQRICQPTSHQFICTHDKA